MRTVLHQRIPAALFLFTLLSEPLPAQPSEIAASQPSDIAAFVSASFESRHLPGAAVIVVDRDRTQFFGTGEDANGQAISASTRFYIGSLSKAFTAAAVLQLVERGQVDLDVPVRRYLPEFHPADPRAERITPRHLLNQTSGMSIAGDREWQRPQPRNLKEAVARLATLRLSSDPGTRFSYHNPNYSVLARLVEVVGGSEFAAYLRANIFLPLGMRDTDTVDFLDEKRDGVPLGHLYAFGRARAMAAPAFFVNGAGGVVTTPADYALWLSAQMNDGVGRNGVRILSAASIRAAHTPALDGYGFGWNRAASGRISHSGGLATFGAYAAMQDGRAVAVFVPVAAVMAPSRDVGLRILDGDLTPIAASSLWLWDWALLVACVLVWFFCVRGIVRAPAWARRVSGRARWRQALATSPLLLLAAIVLVGVPLVVSQVLSWSWIWLWYYVPLWTTFLLSAAGASLLVAGARLIAHIRVSFFEDRDGAYPPMRLRPDQ